MSKKNDNLLAPLIDAVWDAGVIAWNQGSKIACNHLGIKTEKQIEEDKIRIEKEMKQRKIEEEKIREQEVENKNKIKINGATLNFNDLFFNCGLKNKLKDMPILEKVSNYKSVDIYSFKLPIGVTVSSVQEKIESISDFFEVSQMNIKLQKKNGLMDIIVTKDNMFNRIFEYQDMKLGENLKIPVGHFINQDHLEKMLVIDMSKDEIAHGFIGSTTGGGKSNLIRIILLNWIMNKPPEDLELFLIDGKGGTDYMSFLNAPHVFMNKCFNDATDIVEILNGSLNEILRRNRVFQKAEANNFREFTEMGGHMPRRVIIFDEYAMYHGTKLYPDMQSKVGKICSTGRSAGIHIIVATQDGRKEVLDSMIKYNMPLKIGFKCANAQHSKNITSYEGLETINRIGVGRIYGLPIDTEYIQFKTMKAPSSKDIKKMIEDKYKDQKSVFRLTPEGNDRFSTSSEDKCFFEEEYIFIDEECED